jgi:hypothetical protein
MRRKQDLAKSYSADVFGGGGRNWRKGAEWLLYAQGAYKTGAEEGDEGATGMGACN